MFDGTEYFECSCYSDEHTLRFILDLEENELYTTIYLNQYNSFFKRVWIAIKYILGYKCKFGHWDCWILKLEDTKRMINMLQKIKE